jgi:hypothetical protein
MQPPSENKHSDLYTHSMEMLLEIIFCKYFQYYHYTGLNVVSDSKYYNFMHKNISHI